MRTGHSPAPNSSSSAGGTGLGAGFGSGFFAEGFSAACGFAGRCPRPAGFAAVSLAFAGSFAAGFGVEAEAAAGFLCSLAFGTGVGDLYVWFAFIGAGIAAIVVYGLGSIGAVRHSPLGLVLAGAIVATFLTSLTTAILIFDQSTLDAVRLWTAGSLTGRTMAQAKTVAPYILTGLVAALFLGRHLTTLSLGADASRALGQNPVIWRGASVVTVILLAGGAVALAGPIGFVGLVVPHMVRMIAGVDYRWVIPFSALGGALLVVVSDTAGRLVFGSQSFPVGVTIALIGAPFFLYLARTRLRGAA